MRNETGPATGSVALFLLVVLLLATPFTEWWMRLQPPWYLPYVGWAAVIGIGGWLIERGYRREL
ncbi:MAG: hypothetical protein ACLFMS_02050 [Halorhodospira sp.]